MSLGGLVPRAARGTVLAAALMSLGLLVPAAHADVGVTWMEGAHAPGTPRSLDKVGVVKVGPRSARNVFVLVPGAPSGAAKLVPLARTVVRGAHGWQVWVVERRQNLLEDHSVLDRAKRGQATADEVFDYYLRWTTDPTIATHVRPVADAEVGFARRWGMRVAVEDLRRVVKAAARHARRVVLGGHSLGGGTATAYATWDFAGRPGVRDLAGLVFIDGGTNPEPIAASSAKALLTGLDAAAPWSTDAGPAPTSGLSLVVPAALANLDPGGTSIMQGWSGLPASLNPSFRVTNEALFGLALDSDSSPENLLSLQVHAGGLAETGDPRPWKDGGIVPIQRFAGIESGWGLQGTDGVEWYFPLRLTYDWLFAVANGRANPAQRVLDVQATHGDDIDVPIYAFSSGFGDTSPVFGRGGVLGAARALARRSHLTRRDVLLVDRPDYTHQDPIAAFPRNAFVAHLLPFLKRIATRR